MRLTKLFAALLLSSTIVSAQGSLEIEDGIGLGGSVPGLNGNGNLSGTIEFPFTASLNDAVGLFMNICVEGSNVPTKEVNIVGCVINLDPTPTDTLVLVESVDNSQSSGSGCCIDLAITRLDFQNGSSTVTGRIFVEWELLPGSEDGFIRFEACDCNASGGTGKNFYIQDIGTQYKEFPIGFFNQFRISDAYPGYPVVQFIRGDCDGNGILNIQDVFCQINEQFNGAGLVNCDDALDVDDNGLIEITDIVVNLNRLFGGPGLPPSPCNPDTTADELGCDFHAFCASSSSNGNGSGTGNN